MAEAKGKDATTQAGLISSAQAAKLIMVSDEWIRQLAKRGYIPKAGRNAYPLVGVVQGYIRFLKDEERRTSIVQNESGLKAARQREVELRIAERERTLVPRDEAEAALEIVVGVVNDELNGLPARITRDITQRTKIETEVYGSLKRISEALETGSSALASGSAIAAANAEDDA